MSMSLITGMLGSVMIFFSLYLIDEFNVTKSNAILILSIASFAGIWAGPVGGWISDKIGRLPIIIVSSIVGGIIIFCIRWTTPGIGMYVLLLLSGVNMYIGAPVSEAFIMGQTSARHRSTIYGMYYLMGTGSTLVAPLMGLLIDNIGYQSTFMYAGAASIIVSLICGTILWTSRREPSQVAEVQN
jgi:MFS family permease